ncbi:MAG: NUDIX hydrolase [Nitrososphaerales archaeon]
MLDSIRVSLQKSPGKRLVGDEYDTLPSAAVCLILKPDSTLGQVSALLVRRRISETDPWSGQMAFPGGRTSRRDQGIMKTAVREVLEETGIDLTKCEMLGTLDDLIPTSNRSLRVTPFVALAPESTVVSVDGHEIVDYVWIPIAFFVDKNNSATYDVQRSEMSISVRCFPYLGTHIVWGMTLRMIEDFITKVHHSASFR